jgi:periplasmic protein CpxP/Spy
MKKLILAVALVVGLTTFAQGKKGDGKERMNPEEQVEVILKKMTSELSLDAKQQDEVKAILVEQSKKRIAKKEEFKTRREKGDKPTDEEIATMKKNRIDEELAMKNKMKKVLSEDQYKKWTEAKKDRMEKFKGKGKRGVKPVDGE